MDGHEVIAQKALLLITDQVGLQNLLPALRAPHNDEGPHHPADAAFATEYSVRPP